MKETVVISGSIAQLPTYGGHTWVFLQYALGFKKMGWDVLFLDYLSSDMCRNARGENCGIEDSVNLEYFVTTMNEFGLADSFSLLYEDGARTVGLPRAKVLEKTAQSALLINVMGFLRDSEILSRARRRLFLDIDPGFGQMWQELGLCSMFDGHDCYMTIGENIGQDTCSIPTCGVKWIPSRQPVDLDYWKPAADPVQRGFTTVASWRGTFGPVEFRGRTYGLRVHEFRKMAPLPKSTGERFDIALNIHPADREDRVLLESNGWRLLDPRSISADPWQYRNFINESAAEFMVAKNMYVDTRSGWFSDRSCCYLASGKPVLAQDTGLRSLYPVGKGLMTFTSLDEAISGVRDISQNYAAHSRAARDIAVEYFDSTKVLSSLLAKVN